MTKITKDNITGLVLAGGKASRMGGADKGLVKINNQAMVKYVLDILKPQVSDILINANRNKEKYEEFGYAVISDQLGNFQGPLAGIATAMTEAKTNYICTCPCDGPLIAKDLVKRLITAFEGDDEVRIAVADDGKRMQPVYALIDCDLHKSLMDYLARGERKIDLWFAQHRYKSVDFSDQQECFININTPEDQAKISQQLL